MNDRVKSLLQKHGYVLKLSIDRERNCVRFDIPNRVQKPEIDAYYIEYHIKENLLIHKVDEDIIEIECPSYAIRSLILVDVRTVCNYIGFDTNLLEFSDGLDKIDEDTFFHKMWPKGVLYTDEDRKKEYDLKELVKRASNAIIPFHESFTFEAQQLGVELGYVVVRSFAIGGNNE